MWSLAFVCLSVCQNVVVELFCVDNFGTNKVKNCWKWSMDRIPDDPLSDIIIFFTLGIKDPEGFGKKLEENCRSDHYSGQSSNTKEWCSWIAALAWKCAGTKSCPSLVAGVMTNFLGQKWEKIRGRLINWAESLDRNWLKKAVCCKTRIFVFFLSCRQLGYWSSFSGSRGNIRVCQGTENCDVPNKRSTALPRNQSKSIGPFPARTT